MLRETANPNFTTPTVPPSQLRPAADRPEIICMCCGMMMQAKSWKNSAEASNAREPVRWTADHRKRKIKGNSRHTRNERKRDDVGFGSIASN